MKAKPRIGKAQSALLLGAGALFDALQVPMNVIFIGFLVSPIAWLILGVWFGLNGVNVFSGRRLVAMTASLAVEILPMINTAPAIVLGVAGILFFARLEDKRQSVMRAKVRLKQA